MAVWTNPTLTLYHGTDTASLASPDLQPGLPFEFQVDFYRCRPRTDFGRGFYTTTSETHARVWAHRRSRRQGTGPLNRAVVLRFDVSRDRLASLQSLVFIRATDDFWNFVISCRTGHLTHGRSSSSTPYYDMVCGPVALWPSFGLLRGCDQWSFHTPDAVEALNAEILDVF